MMLSDTRVHTDALVREAQYSPKSQEQVEVKTVLVHAQDKPGPSMHAPSVTAKPKLIPTWPAS